MWRAAFSKKEQIIIIIRCQSGSWQRGVNLKHIALHLLKAWGRSNWNHSWNNDKLSQSVKKVLRSTLRYNIQSKVLNSAPKGVSFLRATKAIILFGSNPWEHKWSDEYVNQSFFFLFYGCYVFSLCEDDSNVSKLISL